MKGLVFTTLLEFLEAEHGLDFVDRLLTESDLPSGGAYTAVATYDSAEMQKIITSLSRLTGKSPKEVAIMAGRALFPALMSGLVERPEQYDSAFSVLEALDGIIHVHVRKLYPDAELPRFSTRYVGDDRMEVEYRSKRPFADLAEGLIGGCVAYFRERIEVRRMPESKDSYSAKFLLTRSAEALGDD